jgi:general stress protein 26
MAGDGKQDYVDSYEDVSMFALASDAEADMLARQTECVFMWTTAEHDPVGVIMSFVHEDGRFWLTATRRRKRIRAIEARPRVAVAVSSRGTNIGISRSVTFRQRSSSVLTAVMNS